MADPRPSWPVAVWPTAGALADRLELNAGQLAWLADVRALERTVDDERLRNYGYTWMPRAHGLPRLLERPKRRLKEVQRIVLREVLDAIPPHDAAHGFRRDRSATTNAAQHVGREVVLRFDLEDFFAAVTAGRVFGLFRLAGYPEGVAHALTGLSTNAVPDAVWQDAPPSRDPHARSRLRRRLATPHLPQGAPTSPALANLCAFTLDRRLDGLARAFGARYTRYADDLTLSGDGLLVEAAPTVRRLVAEIVEAEGFRLRTDKSSLTTRAGRQRVCGVVVNDRLNVARPEATASARCCTTRGCTGRRRPTALCTRTSPRTSAGGSRGSRRSTPTAAGVCWPPTRRWTGRRPTSGEHARRRRAAWTRSRSSGSGRRTATSRRPRW
jgi:hypothetical protein